MRLLFTFWLSCCILGPFPAYAWWETGHQTVARIAVAHLSPEARAHAARILGVEDTPQALADALAAASTWADETKAQTQTGSWHFIDLAVQDDKTRIPLRCPDNNCAPARIRLFAAQLAARQPVDSPWSDLDALRYVVHFVADVHQPLHAVSDADLGGNCEQLDPPVEKARNLHALWDGALVDALNPDSRALATELEARIEQMPSGEQSGMAAGNQDDWVWESHELALNDVYRQLHIPTEPVLFPASCKVAPEAISSMALEIGNAYIDEMKPIVREQLIKAGLRLARLLNESL